VKICAPSVANNPAGLNPERRGTGGGGPPRRVNCGRGCRRIHLQKRGLHAIITAVAARRADTLLTNPRINAVARQGIAFRPLIRALGSQWSPKQRSGADAADVFYREDSAEHEKAVLLAIFNFDSDRPAEKKISFDQIGLGSSVHFQITDLWQGNVVECKEPEHTWKLPPGEAALVRIATERR